MAQVYPSHLDYFCNKIVVNERASMLGQATCNFEILQLLHSFTEDYPMPHGINYVTVVGAGTMGAAIAGHLANAGIPVTLLDIVPTELTDEEQQAGLTLDHPKVRNRIVNAGFTRMQKSKPANLFTTASLQQITVGNIEDNLAEAARKSDWIIEAIIERLEPKQALMERLEELAPEDAIITSNTSGIPIHMINEKCSPEFKQRFLGTHFFNPPRYLHLLELIPTSDTAQATTQRMQAFAESVLGKGVVTCKDTPNFIANRMISFIQSDLMEFAISNGYTIEEIDALTGPLLGRPKTGTFRLNDVVGIDIMAMVGENLYDLVPDDKDRDILRGELGSTLMQTMVNHNLLGNKTGQGFYKTVVDEKGKKRFLGLDLLAALEGRIEYLEAQKPRWDSVGEARNQPLAQRLRTLVAGKDDAAKFVWHTLAYTLSYASKRIPDIAERVVDIDNAMKWGFGWEMGPFEIWDALGVSETLRRMDDEGFTVASWIYQMVANGYESFYIDAPIVEAEADNETASEASNEIASYKIYSPLDINYLEVQQNPLALTVNDIKRKDGAIAENDSASLLEMGDGVLLLEFHSKMNALDEDIFKLIHIALEHLHGDATGLVIGNQGENFSVGANLMVLAIGMQNEQWEAVEQGLRQGQEALMALRRAPKPVVAAPFQRTLGGGAEISMAADRILAHAETYMGLVEVGVGIIPGWGGCKELVRRNVSPHMNATNVSPMPYLRQVFEQIGFAKVSTSAAETRDMGFLNNQDRIIMNRAHLLAEAKQEVLNIASSGYTPPVTTGNVYAAGRDVLASINIEIYSLGQAGYISEHDAKIAKKLGYILTGGDLSVPQWMDEQYFLDLEREALLSLLGTQKTQERVWHMLQTGKPLRN